MVNVHFQVTFCTVGAGLGLRGRAGCLQGRGPAKSIQLVKMSYENKVDAAGAQEGWEQLR